MDEFKTYLKLRADIYQVLAYGFYMELDAALINDLKIFLPVFEKIQGTFPQPSMQEGISLFLQFIKVAEADMASTIADYERHFARVFLSTGFSQGIKSIVPHESVYLSANGLSMQAQRDEVLRCFYDEGVGKCPDFREPEDHISAEMNFISLLSRQTIDAWQRDDENMALAKLNAQLNFIRDHLLKWVFDVCDDLFDVGDYLFYRVMARLTAGFVQADYQFLGELFGKENQS